MTSKARAVSERGAVLQPTGVTRGGTARLRSLVAAVPGTLELAAVVAVMALLLPRFDTVAGFGVGRDARFAAGGLAVTGLPDAVLPSLCVSDAASAEPEVAARLCGGPGHVSGTAAGGGPGRSDLPLALQRALAAARVAFVAPLTQVQGQLDALRAQQRDGEADLRPLADAIGVLEARIEPYAARYELRPGEARGPAALECAAREVAGALAQGAGAGFERSNALLLLAAAIDGRSAAAGLASEAVLPDVSAPGCGSLGASLGAAATLLGEARLSADDGRKNEAMRALLASAGAQWAGAMGLGYLLLRWSRRGVGAATGVGASLLLWAGAAWLARVPWPFAASREFRPGRIDTAWSAAPDVYVLVLAGVGALCLLPGLAGSGGRRHAPQAMSSRVGYAGLVAATGFGWLLLFDLSSHAHPVNRYLALYHQGHLWLAMMVLSVVLFLRQPLARGVGWVLSVAGELSRRIARTFGHAGAWLLLAMIGGIGLAIFGLALANLRQLTSELGRIWLIVGGAWFFFLRAGPLAERLARSGPAGASFWRYVAPMVFVVAVLLGAMLITRDMGPLLIAGYASGGFVAATLAAWWHQRRGAVLLPYLAAVALFASWIGVVTLSLFQLGNVDSTTAARLESLAAPFASNNDQLALVSWFQRATPAEGYGLGASPWCGHAASGRCS
ncbi:MAG: hypothetical protein ABIX46_13455, partial [Burkholderiaceae bacterium]